MVKPDRLFPATAMPDKTWWHALWPDPDGVARALHIEPGMTVVDLGCGDGYFTAAIARQTSPVHVIGVDLDPAMLAQAKAACEEARHCDWMSADAMELRQPIRSAIDFVLIANTFHGVPDKTALAREVAAILVPNGRFAIINWHPIAREETPVPGQPLGPRTELRMSPDATRAVVEPAGFEFEALVELLPYHYGAIFRKATTSTLRRDGCFSQGS
jgi:SAM-dependent methyltransferase